MKGALITETKYIRFLTERQAAEYSGMSLVEFRRVCTVAPVLRAQGRKAWDVVKLDAWLDCANVAHGSQGLVEDAIARMQ